MVQLNKELTVTDLQIRLKELNGCGTVGRAVTSVTRGPKFESIDHVISIQNIIDCELWPIL